MHNSTDFQWDKFHKIWTQQHRSVRRRKLTEQNFENFTVRGHFSKNIRRFLAKFSTNILRLHAAITTQWLQITENSLPNDLSMGCLVSIFTVRIYSKSFSSAVRSVQETYLPKFLATSNVRYLVNQLLHYATWLTDMEEKQAWIGNCK